MKVYRDSLLKMECQPGGDWHPGWGVVPRSTLLVLQVSLQTFHKHAPNSLDIHLRTTQDLGKGRLSIHLPVLENGQ